MCSINIKRGKSYKRKKSICWFCVYYNYLTGTYRYTVKLEVKAVVPMKIRVLDLFKLCFHLILFINTYF